MVRRLVLGALALGLTACAPLGTPTGAPAPVARLASGIVVTGPQGYCVDPEISRPARGFAFLAACAALDPASEVAAPGALALITVQSGAPRSATVRGSETAFRDFLRTEEGTALLGAGDIGGPVALLSSDVSENTVAVYTRNRAPGAIAGTQAESWRLFTDLGDRVVTVTVRGIAEAPLSRTGSRDLLETTLRALRAANPERAS